MKKIFKWSLILLLVFFMIFYGFILYFEYQEDRIPKSLGNYKSKQSWVSEPSQDINEFRTYTYSSAKPENSEYFSRLSQHDNAKLKGFITNFEGRIGFYESRDLTSQDKKLLEHYNFDRSIIDGEDYFYIRLEYEDKPYWNYDVWFFDSQTNILYYFHSNI